MDDREQQRSRRLKESGNSCDSAWQVPSGLDRYPVWQPAVTVICPVLTCSDAVNATATVLVRALSGVRSTAALPYSAVTEAASPSWLIGPTVTVASAGRYSNRTRLAWRTVAVTV